MKKLIIYLIFIMPGITLVAQNKDYAIPTRPLNSINLNLFGDATMISGSYERLFPIGPNLYLTGKLGVGYNEEFQLCLFGPCTSKAKTFITIPHHVTGILGKRRSFFEFGLGGTAIGGEPARLYYAYPIVGYRFLPLGSDKITFRIFAMIPFTGFESDDIIILPLGLTLGISF